MPVDNETFLNAAVKYRVVIFRFSLPVGEKFNLKGQQHRGRTSLRRK